MWLLVWKIQPFQNCLKNGHFGPENVERALHGFGRPQKNSIYLRELGIISRFESRNKKNLGCEPIAPFLEHPSIKRFTFIVKTEFFEIIWKFSMSMQFKRKNMPAFIKFDVYQGIQVISKSKIPLQPPKKWSFGPIFVKFVCIENHQNWFSGKGVRWKILKTAFS